MAIDMFINIDTIKGESQAKGHAEEIEVLSWQWGMTQTGTMHSGSGGGTAKVSVHDLTFTKHVDKSSPLLTKFCCSGKHFPKAKLTIRKAGGDALDYVTIELSNVMISSVTHGGGHSDERLTETVGLNFAQFKYEYTPQSIEGRPSGKVPGGWHIAKNCEA